MTYRAVQLRKFSVITRNHSQCLDREIKMKNEFTYLSEAEEVANELNKPEQEIKTVIVSKEALEGKVL